MNIKNRFRLLMQKKFNIKHIAAFIPLLTLCIAILSVTSTSSFEIDVIAQVYKVIDGDTFDAFPVGRVRLADIDAPERGEEGYSEAKEALTSLILNKKVYLDVDDIYVMDRYSRLICVVYIRKDPEHLLNVNKWLLDKGYARVSDYPNEFNPYTWELYIYYPQELEKETVTITTTRILTQIITTTSYLTTTTHTLNIVKTMTITITAYSIDTVTRSFTKTITVIETTTATTTETLTKLITSMMTVTESIIQTLVETYRETVFLTTTITITMTPEIPLTKTSIDTASMTTKDQSISLGTKSVENASITATIAQQNKRREISFIILLSAAIVMILLIGLLM